jgi:hypothetical protein
MDLTLLLRCSMVPCGCPGLRCFTRWVNTGRHRKQINRITHSNQTSDNEHPTLRFVYNCLGHVSLERMHKLFSLFECSS